MSTTLRLTVIAALALCLAACSKDTSTPADSAAATNPPATTPPPGATHTPATPPATN